jgi:hypothetical protein
VGEGVYVNGVGEATPGLYLLRDFLGVERAEHASEASVFEGVRQRIQKLRYGVGKANGRKDAGAAKGVVAESVEGSVFRAGNVGVDPLDIRQLFDCEFADRSFFALSNPL